MKQKFVSVLQCPEPDCKGDIELIEETVVNGHAVMEGVLECKSCGDTYPIKDGFPILLADDVYDENELTEIA